MKLKYFLMLCILIVVIADITSYMVSDHLKIKETIVIGYDFEINDNGKFGLNLDKDKMHFGNICQGCFSKRVFNLINKNDYREKIIFLIATSNESEEGLWFNFKPSNNWIIERGKEQSFNVTIIIPENASVGNHKGMIIINTYKVWPWAKNNLLHLKLGGCFSKDLFEMINCHQKTDGINITGRNISKND